MTMDSRFDDAARSYETTVQNAIGASGESVRFFADLKVRLMSEQLGPGANPSILDFGCGIGNTTRALSRVFTRSEIVGFDVSHESIAVARESTGVSENVTFVSSAEEGLPIPDANVDAVFTSCVFHHIDPDQRPYWADELRRVLKPGGRLFLFEHNPFNPLTVRVVRRIPFDEGVVLLKASDTTELLRHAGFEVDTPWFYFFFPHLLSALRVFERWLRRVPVGAQYFVVGTRPTHEST
jgi:ubiquinone/menaquinone biosynthesis C-methylase UbiE